MSNSPLVSVIISTYQRPALLREAVASVLRQTVQNFECIVVDDAGRGRLELPDDPRITLIRRTWNGGPVAARNTGIRNARGRYLTFLDDDDLYTPDRLEIGLEGVAKAPVSVCWWRFADNEASKGADWSRSLEGDVYDRILDGPVPHSGATMVTRSQTPFFDERFRVKEDAEWWLRLAHHCEVVTVPKVGYLWRRHPGPRLTKGAVDKVRGHLMLLEVHADYFRTHRRPAVHRWKRVAALARGLGDYRLEREALWRALRFDRSVKTLLQLARSVQTSAVRRGMDITTDGAPSDIRVAGER
jgi:glycosyltransferase involved in cell wall biosynthesis